MRSRSGARATATSRRATASRALPRITSPRSSAAARERVLIAYDRDEAGERAAEKLAEQLIGEGLECYRILFPKGHGRERVCAEGEARRRSRSGVVIRKAQWMGRERLTRAQCAETRRERHVAERRGTLATATTATTV